jgi:hypothetical protein
MSKKLTATNLLAQLDAGTIVPLGEEDWRKWAGTFTIVEEIATGLGGEILLVRRPPSDDRRGGWALVEEPKPGDRVIRPLANEKEARALIADRLAAYERMWDG